MLVPRRLLFKDEIFDLEHVSATFKVNWKRKLTPRIVYIREKMFYFGVYFHKIMGKIVYTSTLPDCQNSHV